MNDRIKAILDQGQSIWYDNIRRALLDSGELAKLIDQGVRGVTSNPSIFEKAIAGSSDYDQELRELAESGQGAEAIFQQLALTDISRTADLLMDLYESSGGEDGYVSLEVNPQLADDTEGTVAEALRLVEALDRPNVMIKVPATEAGVPAIQRLIARGVNVNVTLIFALERYRRVMEAYLEGMEEWVNAGGDASQVASVASFFVSRVDVVVDAELSELGLEDLKGQIAIANAKMAYQQFQEFFSGDRWQDLSRQGARLQRPLWASTSTKDPSYPDTMYADALIGPHTVNTLPPATLREVMDHGATDASITAGMQEAQAQLERLAEVGIDLDDVTSQLEFEGVESFAKAYQRLLASLQAKLAQLESDRSPLELELGEYQSRYQQSLSEVTKSNVVGRIWQKDHTVWNPDPEEISNRLGWLTIPAKMQGVVHELDAFAEGLYHSGYRQAVLLGMGGSSLAPEVFRQTFGVAQNRLDLTVLDSTDPRAIQRLDQSLDLEQTLFIVATKSGSTVETLSFFKYFYNRVAATLGTEAAGDHFVAITDPGSGLADLAERYDFRRTFANDPNIGGRYSALSYFGLVPAALVGVELKELLERALTAGCGCESCVPCGQNPAAELGTAIAELAKSGRDKLTFFLSDGVDHFGDWVEQLLAESTGKDGKGILPVVGEPAAEPRTYRQDRVFVHLRLAGDSSHDEVLGELKEEGHPLIRINLTDQYDMGGQMFLWEMATAVAGERLGIHPFNQPNVESAKIRARQMVEAYLQAGELPAEEPSWQNGQLSLYWGSANQDDRPQINDLGEGLAAWLAAAEPESYISLHAYLTPTEDLEGALRALQGQLLEKTGRAVTFGFGPRFLHSTGQLHKGDAGHGLFLQLTAEPTAKVPIPEQAGSDDSGMEFGVLIRAQAMGDRQALSESGRTVLRVELGDDAMAGLKALQEAVRHLDD